MLRDRFGRLLLFCAVAGALWGLLSVHESTPEEDRLIVLVIGVIYAVAVLVMLIGTRVWTVRGLGLLGTLSADAVLYTTSAAAAYGWTDGAVEWRLDLVRALFLVGGALMAYGLIRWVVDTRWGTRDEAPV